MEHKPKKQSVLRIRVLAVCVTLVFLLLGVFIVKSLIDDDGGKKKRRIQMVTLLKPPPPPPPEVKQKPPEPQEEKLKEPEPEEAPEEAEVDEGPMDEDLGLDAEASGMGDDFGLRAKKGGRSLIGGDLSAANLLRKYAWYTAIMQEDLRKRVNKHMEANGGIPKGHLTAYVMITLDNKGIIKDVVLKRSSGSKKMDTAVKEALVFTQVDEPPPQGMPRVVELKITSKG